MKCFLVLAPLLIYACSAVAKDIGALLTLDFKLSNLRDLLLGVHFF